MRRFTSLLMATSSLVVFAAEAPAADLPRAMPTKAPIVAPVRTAWTGCYLGGNIGYGRARNVYGNPPGDADAPDQTIDGVVGGGQVGCDYQFSDPFVVGIQGMFDWTSMSGTGDPYVGGKVLKARVPWLATLTGRVGYAFQPNWLLYVKGGAAWTRTDFDFFFTSDGSLFASGDGTRSGWTVGGGGEWMFAPSWSIFLEYNHLFMSRDTVTIKNTANALTFPFNFKQDIDLVQLGINYRFNWWR
jgi:outer membrane immunogenic protein